MKSSHGKNSVGVTVSCNRTVPSRTQTCHLDIDDRETGMNLRVTKRLSNLVFSSKISRNIPLVEGLTTKYERAPWPCFNLVLLPFLQDLFIWGEGQEGHTCSSMPEDVQGKPAEGGSLICMEHGRSLGLMQVAAGSYHQPAFGCINQGLMELKSCMHLEMALNFRFSCFCL